MDSPAAYLDAAFWGSAAAILLFLVLSAFFSGSETALTAASRGKLRSMADRGSRGAARALEVREDGERLIGAILLGNNVVNISAASLATALFTRLFGDSGVALATLVMTVGMFALAVPGSVSFAGEFAILAGVFDRGWGFAAVGAAAIVLAALYALRLISAILHVGRGSAVRDEAGDLVGGEVALVAPLVVLLAALSVWPAAISERSFPADQPTVTVSTEAAP